jgi:hypothetical protein
MKVSQFLREAKNLIDTPEKWVQGVLAAGRDSQQVQPSSKFACRFCSIGAVDRALFDLIDHSVPKHVIGVRAKIFLMKATRQIIGAVAGSGDISLVSKFNDSQSHAEVMRLWDLAIQMAEEEEAREAS